MVYYSKKHGRFETSAIIRFNPFVPASLLKPFRAQETLLHVV